MNIAHEMWTSLRKFFGMHVEPMLLIMHWFYHATPS